MANPKDNVYLENMISIRDFAMFIFGSKNDEKRLTNAGPWRIASTVVNPVSNTYLMLDSMYTVSIQSQREIHSFPTDLPPEFAQFGITRFAANLFDAPAPVKHFFCDANKVYSIHLLL